MKRAAQQPDDPAIDHQRGGLLRSSLVVLGVVACAGLQLANRDMAVPTDRVGAFEHKDEPADAVRLNAPRAEVEPIPQTITRASVSESNAIPGSEVMVGSDGPFLASVQAGGPAGPPLDQHDSLEARWAKEPAVDHDGVREAALIARQGLDPKVVLDVECRTSLCRVHANFPSIGTDADPRFSGGMRVPDNPHPERDVTTVFYPLSATNTETVGTYSKTRELKHEN